MMTRRFPVAAVFLAAGLLPSLAAAPTKGDIDPNQPVSFYRQIRPILQANCQGCHQPAKAKGDYVLTDHEKLLTPGESGKKPVVGGKPEESLLLTQIVPKDGQAEMPKGRPPLPEADIKLVQRWILEGASDDTPPNARQEFNPEHPPVYTRAPVITSLDYSPDGTWLALAGFHEVLLQRAEDSGIEARFIGLAERIEAVRFSPDGKWLAVAGGQPARMGEVEIWDVDKRKLVVSAPVGFDTVYGVSWSPDGKLVAFGCPDKTIRAIDARTGKQVLQQMAHEDWVIDTVFSLQGTHVISAGRDMSAKLTEVATQRFIDNITSITPGALRGGLHSVARHPSKDEILVGGSDGTPQIYQVFRQAARKIGDNATLLRRFPAMEGRIFGVKYSPDGNRIAAAATLDGHGLINIYAAKFDSTIPTNILKSYEKTAGEYSKEERDAIEAWVTSDVKLLHSTAVPNSAVYSISFRPDGKRIAAGTSAGTVLEIDTESGQLERVFAAVPMLETETLSAEATPADVLARKDSPPTSAAATTQRKDEPGPKPGQVVALEIQPSKIQISSLNEHVQLLVTARLASGDTADVTRAAAYVVSDGLGEVSPSGRFRALKEGAGALTVVFGGQTNLCAIDLENFQQIFTSDFVRDVNPVLSKLGCNAGTCHGAREGKNGFKLSLRGYDPVFDVRSLSDDLAARRMNFASPDNSLMLLKATGAVPHEGGQRTTTDSEYYAIIRQWIGNGAHLDAKSPRVTNIAILPQNPVVQEIGARQQMRILASYSDGATRDVTAEAFIETGNADVASTDGSGLVTSIRRGEAPILARYEGRYAATTLTVMGDRSAFVWKEPPFNNRIDELVAAKWKRMKILPSPLCSDAEFARRVSLDLIGLPPTPEELRAFLNNPRDSRSKRDALIEKLLNSPEFVDHWASKWADLLQVNRKFLGEDGAQLFREWIRQQIAGNAPYDQFVRALITATGSNKENPPASYWKILRQPTEAMENTTHLFLATRFNCNKCHDHPFERWTQDQYYQLSQYFAQVDRQKDPASGDRAIGGTAVEGATPLFEKILDKSEGGVKHDRTGKIVAPQFPYPVALEVASTNATRREQLAAWITSADNRYFALSYVNRLWGYLLGNGLIEPLDDIRAGNPATNPDLLEHLTREFVESGFNARHIIRQICQSRVYQLSIVPNEWNSDDKINYSHATARRLPAEVLLDTVFRATGSQPRFPGVKPGTRAAQLPDSAVDLPSGILANLGRPPRESACECERSNDIKLGSVMSLLSGPAVTGAVNDSENQLAKLVEHQTDDRKVAEEIFLRILNRPATAGEIEAALKSEKELNGEHRQLTNQLAQAEAAWAKTKPKLEYQRATAVAAAEKALASYLVERAPHFAAAEREHIEKLSQAEQMLKDYEPSLPEKVAQWETTLQSNRWATLWVALDPKEVKGSGATRLEKQPGGVIRSYGSRGELSDYTISSELAVTNITGIKLEVLPDDDLPGFGPGYQDGDFLLSEIVVESGSKTNGAKLARVKISDTAADWIKPGLNLKDTFDGKSDQGLEQGWGVGKAVGAPHWAAFAFEKPIGDTNGAALKVNLQFHFQADHEIGRFRIWYTTSTPVLAEGLPADLAPALAKRAPSRDAAENARVTDYYRGLDSELRNMEHAVVTARKPLPEDSHQKELETDLSRAARPVLTDPALIRLRNDAALSAKQLANPRLTAAQDLAWALINTPAFLFNH